MKMTTNRAVALVSVAAAVVTGVLLPLLDVLKGDLAKAIFLGVIVLAITAVVIVWLIGWQKYESRSPYAASKKVIP